MDTPDLLHLPAWDLIRALRRRGVRLEVVGDRIRVDGPRATLDAFPGLQDILKTRKPELLEALAAEMTEPLTPDYVPLPGPVTPWPPAPFKVPKPCSRCRRVAWLSDGPEELPDGTVLCAWCVTPADVAAGSRPIASEGWA